ncbi:MAG: S1 RNA-binding domain-containing protein [Bacilli bacterium]|nr:S1 RNA-binding domain-containing protein [Bacilli bacterium]
MPKVGEIVEGTVVKVYPSYAILLFDDGSTGLLHISELSHSYVHNFSKYVTAGNIYSVKVISVDEEKKDVKVSIKQMSQQDRHRSQEKRRIDPDEVSFNALKEKLPEWIEEANKENEK